MKIFVLAFDCYLVNTQFVFISFTALPYLFHSFLKPKTYNLNLKLYNLSFGMKQNEEDLLHECLTCNKRFLTENILKYHTSYFHKEKQGEHPKKKPVAGEESNTSDIVTNFMKVLNSIA